MTHLYTLSRFLWPVLLEWLHMASLVDFDMHRMSISWLDIWLFHGGGLWMGGQAKEGSLIVVMSKHFGIYSSNAGFTLMLARILLSLLVVIHHKFSFFQVLFPSPVWSGLPVLPSPSILWILHLLQWDTISPTFGLLSHRLQHCIGTNCLWILEAIRNRNRLFHGLRIWVYWPLRLRH